LNGLAGEESENEDKEGIGNKKDEYSTTEEVIKILKISKTTLWRYENQGLLHPNKIGSRKSCITVRK
jgi:hypothetical protein